MREKRSEGAVVGGRRDGEEMAEERVDVDVGKGWERSCGEEGWARCHKQCVHLGKVRIVAVGTARDRRDVLL